MCMKCILSIHCCNDSGPQIWKVIAKVNCTDTNETVFDSSPGIKHHDVVCDGCAQEGITGIRWKCVKCNEYDLCTMCYLNGKHRFEHEFERMDTPTYVIH